MLRYFLKDQPKNKFYDSKGQPVAFEEFGPARYATGVIVLDDSIPEQAATIADLNSAVERVVGGVRASNEVEVDEVKKKLLSMPEPTPDPFFSQQAPNRLTPSNLDPLRGHAADQLDQRKIPPLPETVLVNSDQSRTPRKPKMGYAKPVEVQ